MSASAELNPRVGHEILDDAGGFRITDEAVDLGAYRWEDWISFALFWMLASIVFYQVFTRYVLEDSAGWTEEIARYVLVAVVFIGAAMSVRRNNHIQVDFFYRLMPRRMGRVVATAVDLFRCVFLGYATWLTWLMMQKIGMLRMAIVDLPMGLVFGAMLFGFALMFWRALEVARRHWTLGTSILEDPESAFADAGSPLGVEETK